VVNKIKNRMASEQGFTLIELLVVIVILGILVAIAVPSYLSLTSKAQGAAAKANVSSTIPAAEILYQNNAPNSYTGMTRSALLALSPGLSPNVKAGPNSTNDGYCIQDTEDGTNYAWYSGGAGGTSVITYGTTQCPAAYTVG